MRKFIYTW